MAWWDDLWLNEAFATWMAFKVVDDWKPEWSMWHDFESHRAPALRARRAGEHAPDLRRGETRRARRPRTSTSITYEKGASVVRMLESWLGAERVPRGRAPLHPPPPRGERARGGSVARARGERRSGRSTPVVRAVARAARASRWCRAQRVDRGGSGAPRRRPGALLREPEGARRRARSRDAADPARACACAARAGRTRSCARWRTPRRPRSRSARPTTCAGRTCNADEASFVRALHDAPLLARARPGSPRACGRSSAWACSATSGRECARAARDSRTGSTWSRALGERAEPDVLGAALGAAGLARRPGGAAGRPERSAARFRGWLGRELRARVRAARLEARARARARTSASCARSLLSILGGARRGRGRARGRRGADRRLSEEAVARSTPNLAGPVVELAARRGDKARFERYLRAMKRARTPQERTRFELALGAFRDPALVERALALALTDAIPTQDVVPLLGRLLGEPDRARARPGSSSASAGRSCRRACSPGLASRLVSALPGAAEAALPPAGRRVLRARIRSRRRRARCKQALERFDLDAELRERAPARAARVPTRARRRWRRSFRRSVLARPFAAVREACAEVAARARHVAIDVGRARALRRRASARRARRHSPTAFPALGGDAEGLAAYVLMSRRAELRLRLVPAPAQACRDCRATGRSRPRCASASSATGASQRARAARDRRARASRSCSARLPRDAPIDELMELYARALRELGECVHARAPPARSPGFVEEAGGSAAALVRRLARDAALARRRAPRRAARARS